jgi:ribosomal protein S12 methylthiotransferase accessory factor
VARALTEVNQFLPGALDGRRRRLFSRQLPTTAFLQPDAAAPPRRLDELPDHATGDLAEAVERCVELAARRDLETLVVDQSRPEIGLSVVKVVVPGLRHFWARLGPGRLYRVPVELGWVEGPLAEDDLNPAHLLI